jgi:hypothetical protein
MDPWNPLEQWDITRKLEVLDSGERIVRIFKNSLEQ